MLAINIKYDTIVYWFIICYSVVTLLPLYLQDWCRDLYVNVVLWNVSRVCICQGYNWDNFKGLMVAIMNFVVTYRLEMSQLICKRELNWANSSAVPNHDVYKYLSKRILHDVSHIKEEFMDILPRFKILYFS